MTDDELKRLEALCEAATPGPWETDGVVYVLGPTEPLANGGTTQKGIADSYEESDADFIAAARVAMPAAIAEIRRLRGLLKDAECGTEDKCAWCGAMRIDMLPDLSKPHTDDCPAFTPDGEVKRWTSSSEC